MMDFNESEEILRRKQLHASATLKAMLHGTFHIEVIEICLPRQKTEICSKKIDIPKPTHTSIYPDIQTSNDPCIETCPLPSSPEEKVQEYDSKYKSRRKLLFKSLSPPKVPRPPNSFMIFGREYRSKLSKLNPKLRNKNISEILGNMWRKLSDAKRMIYDEKAREAAAEHKRQNPTYVYNPQEARIRKAQREQAKLALRAQRQRKSSLTPEEECSPPITPQQMPHMSHLPPLMRHTRSAMHAGAIPPLTPAPHKVLHPHHHQQGPAATAAVSASVREQVMHGMAPPSPSQHAFAASPPPRFYPSYEGDTYHQQQHSHLQSQQHHYPSPQQPSWYQFPHQQHQVPGSSCSYGTMPHGRSMAPHPGVAGFTGSAAPYMPPAHQHQGLQMPGGPTEEEEDLATMPSVSLYEVEGALPPQQQQPKVEEAVEEQTQPSNPDAQPLPPFQHAFGSTEIGRFAHEGFSAQDYSILWEVCKVFSEQPDPNSNPDEVVLPKSCDPSAPDLTSLLQASCDQNLDCSFNSLRNFNESY